jgi:hypothetical protein
MVCVELAFTGNPRRLAARAAHRERPAELHQRGVLALAGPWGDDSGALDLAVQPLGAQPVIQHSR